MKPVLYSVLLLGACMTDAGSVAQNHNKVAVVDEYERRFTFSEPTPCDLFLHRRITDEAARIVEYDAKMATGERSLVYSIVKDDPLPLKAALYHGNKETFRVELADHALRVDADGSPVLSVTGYDLDAFATAAHAIDDDAGLALLACALPVHKELGAIPQFLLNRTSGGRDPNQPDVSQTSTSQQPILDWKGRVTLLGAYVLAGACLHTQDWQCPCLRYHDDIVGSVVGQCGYAIPAWRSESL